MLSVMKLKHNARNERAPGVWGAEVKGFRDGKNKS